MPEEPRQINPDTNRGRELHRRLMRMFDEAKEGQDDIRKRMNFDSRFIHRRGSQWDDHASKARGDRPKPEVNLVVKKLEAIKGDQRQSRIDAKIRAAGGGAKERVAQAYEGIIRSITQSTRVKAARDGAFDEAVDCGMGAYLIETQEVDEESFDGLQEPCVKPIRNARNTVYWHGDGVDSQHRDSGACFVVTMMERGKFERRWPKARAADSTLVGANGPHKGWSTKTHLQVGDVFVREPYTAEIGLFSNGEVYDLGGPAKSVLDELEAQGVSLRKSKKVERWRVDHYKVSGSEILEGPNRVPCKYIPVVMVYGFLYWDQDGRQCYGLARHAIDAQRDYNYSIASIQEAAAVSAKDPVYATRAMVEGEEREWSMMGVRNKPVYFFNPDPTVPDGRPFRLGPASVQSALIQQLSQAEQNIKATTGVFGATLGEIQLQQSGQAVMAAQAKADAVTFGPKDNLRMAVAYEAECLLSMVPQVYDTERQVRILREDDETEDLQLVTREVADEETGAVVSLHDLRAGRYDIVVDIGPSYATKRVEALNALTALAGQVPELGSLGADVIAGELDVRKAGELVDRFRRRYIMAGVIDPNDEEMKEILESIQRQMQLRQALQGQQGPSGMERALMAMQQKKFENEILREAAEIDETVAKRVKDLTDSLETYKDLAPTPENIAAMGAISKEILDALASNDQNGGPAPGRPRPMAPVGPSLG